MTNTIPEFKIDLKDRLFLIAGPCVIESRDHVLFMADATKEDCVGHRHSVRIQGVVR